MIVPYTLVIIKPLTVGRGEGPEVLSAILDHCPVALRKFRALSICDTTLVDLTSARGPHLPTLDYEAEKIHPLRQAISWICVFTHIDRVTDPTDLINKFCGPVDPRQCSPQQVRYTYGGYFRFGVTAHPSDTVVHVSVPERVLYETNMLFLNFNEELL